MKTLDEHNSERWDTYRMANDNSPRPNGIACPECGSELKDTNPTVVLTSSPPKKDIHCDKCKYKGYRIA